MNIYVYSDESGVFDKVHNDIYVFGGIIAIGNSKKEEWSRKYSVAEKVIRLSRGINKNYELKATNVTNKDKSKLFRSLNNCHKFGVIINQHNVLDSIYQSKKDKQRYLDYVYKIAVKRAMVQLINNGHIASDEVERIYFYVDEHTTATNGCYELRQSLEQEFKFGTYNFNYSKYFPPLFNNMKDVQLEYCNSKSKLLVRAADIVANKIFYIANTSKDFSSIKNVNIIYQP